MSFLFGVERPVVMDVVPDVTFQVKGVVLHVGDWIEHVNDVLPILFPDSIFTNSQ
jgi:hypothetical protein